MNSHNQFKIKCSIKKWGIAGDVSTQVVGFEPHLQAKITVEAT